MSARLQSSGDNSKALKRPIADYMRTDDWKPNDTLHAIVPMNVDEWVRIINATPGQAAAALNFLRELLVEWTARRPFASKVVARLGCDNVTAHAYTEALHIADMLVFTSSRLLALYAGILHSMPLYRLYPATPERQAIELWWPWGRVAPLVDGGPCRPPVARKKVLDPSILTATRPQDIVREVMERTGINRTTAQRMTAGMRAEMRRKRCAKALAMLHAGKTRAAVARAVGLSPSRISAMFKGQKFGTSRDLRGKPAVLRV